MSDCLIHADFVPLLEHIKEQLSSVRQVVVLADGQTAAANTLSLACEYEDCRRRNLQ